MSLAQDISDLLVRIRLGEDSSLELKAVHWRGDKMTGPEGRDVADEIASLANSMGGELLLGVDDKSREVSGIPPDKLDYVEQQLANWLDTLIDPPPTVHVRRIELPNQAGDQKPLLWVQVPRSLFVHRSPKGYLTRVGSTKRALSTEQLARLIQRRNQAGIVWFDELPVNGCRFEDLSRPLWERFVGDGDDDPRLKLQKMKLLTRDEDGQEWASVSGCLMCSEEPRRWLRSSYVQCVRYLGTERDADQQHDAQDCSGPLDQQIQQAVQFVLRNMQVGARKNLGRVDYPQFHPRAVFEAIANAVAHRDYSIPGTPVRVHQFQDRLEVDSAGALANSLTVDVLRYRQATRNELLVSLLARCPVGVDGVSRRTMMEKRGEGVPVVLDYSERLSGRLPEYRLIGDDLLKLTLFAAEVPRQDDDGVSSHPLDDSA